MSSRERFFVNRLSISGASHSGIVRAKNEDNFCIAADPGAINCLAVVADGVGGHIHGDIASFFCCRFLLEEWRAGGFGEKKDNAELAGNFRDCIRRANEGLCGQNSTVRQGDRMCTTLVAALFTPEKIFVFNVGDSPFMLQRRGILHQVTEDHRWGDSHTIISRAVGVKSNMEIDSHILPRIAGDRYLLCSDGLTCCVPDEKIGETLMNAAVPRAAVDSMLKATLCAGAPDNVTIISAFEC